MDPIVRPPHASELRACRLLLPEVFAHGASGLLVAVGSESFRFLGAASFQLLDNAPEPAWQAHVHVVRTHARRGVGRRLMGAIVARAREQQVARIEATVHGDDAGAASFLGAIGFRLSSRVRVFESDVETAWREAEDLRRRLLDRGRIPADVRVVPLSDAPREEVIALLAAPAGDASSDSSALPQLAWSDHWCRPAVMEMSPVVMHGDRAVAVVIAERTHDVVTVSWRVVASAYRSGWANIVLGHAALDRMRRSAARTMRFTSTSLTPDTERMTAVFGVREVAQRRHYTLPLEATPCVA